MARPVHVVAPVATPLILQSVSASNLHKVFHSLPAQFSYFDDVAVGGNGDGGAGVKLPECTGKSIRLFGFTVDYENPTLRTGNLFGPPVEFIHIGVTGKCVDGVNFGADGVEFAEDVNLFVAAGEPGAESVLRAPADDENRIAFIFDGVADVVADAAGFGHPGGAENDARFG